MTSNGMAFFPANFMLQTSHEDHDHHHHSSPPSLNPILQTSCTPQDFHGVASFLGKRSMSFSGADQMVEEGNNGEDEFSDDGSQAGEKKRRLNMEQVKTLEKNFELGNKLEPERKMQLARALGLQPRQIAIWFQNRRARWKTKQLEKDYDLLKRQFEAVKSDNESLKSQNQKLQAEIMGLKSREPTESINLNKETEGSSSNRSENSSDNIKLDISRTPPAIDQDSPQHHHQQLSHHPTSRPLFPTSLRPPALAQLFQTSSRSHDQSQKLDNNAPHTHTHNIPSSKEETASLSNMFCGMDDHSGFWPWLEQQHFN